jgi:hypothetical protein
VSFATTINALGAIVVLRDVVGADHQQHDVRRRL